MNHALIDKGIVLPSGEIGRDKINLLSGAYTPPLVEMLWTVTGGDTETADPRLLRVGRPVYRWPRGRHDGSAAYALRCAGLADSR